MNSFSLLLLLASANGLHFGPALGARPASPRLAPSRAAPSMVLDRIRGIFKRKAAADEPTVPAPGGMPPPVPAPSDVSNLSAMDQFLVKMGMKNADECEIPEEGEDLMEQIKCAGRAGIISYIIWEWIFWLTAIPVASFGYYQATGSWPDLSDGEDQAKVGASVFAFVNVARFLVPLRVGLALSTVPWVDDNIVNPFIDKFGGDADDAEKEQ